MHVLRIDIADVSDSKGVVVGHLAGIDHEPFFLQLVYRLGERSYGMCGRGEAPFSVLALHGFPLVVEIQAVRDRALPSALQKASADATANPNPGTPWMHLLALLTM